MTCDNISFFSHTHTLAIIGFTQRNRTVSEDDPAAELFQITIDLATQRTTEREHAMTIRVLESSGTAIVEPLLSQTNPNYDALFGSRDAPGEPVRQVVIVPPGASTIPPLLAVIRNNFRPEDVECFTLSIFPDDVPGRRELFMCNEDDCGMDNYFCRHTICITDHDGELHCFLLCSRWCILQNHFRLHLWRQPTLLMRVWVQ